MKQHSLKDKWVLITGASSGLGEAIAYESAKHNASLVLCARNMDKLHQVANNCQKLTSGEVVIRYLDIMDYQSVEELDSFLTNAQYSIDYLVNNAGVGIFKQFLDTAVEEMDLMFSVNVLGLMALTQKIALHMAENKSGHIINIASQAGKMATPKSSIYAATKFAVIGFSNALRLELKPLGIKVTTVNPGPMRTAFFDQADPSGEYLNQVAYFVTEPENLAKKIVYHFGKNKREINMPWLMEFGSKAYGLFPHIGDYLAGSIFNKK